MFTGAILPVSSSQHARFEYGCALPAALKTELSERSSGAVPRLCKSLENSADIDDLTILLSRCYGSSAVPMFKRERCHEQAARFTRRSLFVGIFARPVNSGVYCHS
jgi:hypothetical protein